MAEAAERGVFHRHGMRIERIDLDDPAEAVRLVRFLVHVEAVDELAPGLPQARHAVSLIALRLRAAEASRPFAALRAAFAPEVAVEIFLGGEVGAPGRDPSGAIIERAEDVPARRVGARLHPLVPHRGSIDCHRRVGRADAAVIGAVAHGPPPILALRDFDDGDAVGRHFDRDELGRHVWKADQILASDAGEHDLLVGIFVIDAEEAAPAAFVERQEGDVVVVVTELLQLRRGALPQRVEGRRVGKQGIAPTEQHVSPVSLGDMVGAVDAGRDFREGEAVGGVDGASRAPRRATPARTAKRRRPLRACRASPHAGCSAAR